MVIKTRYSLRSPGEPTTFEEVLNAILEYGIRQIAALNNLEVLCWPDQEHNVGFVVPTIEWTWEKKARHNLELQEQEFKELLINVRSENWYCGFCG